MPDRHSECVLKLLGKRGCYLYLRHAVSKDIKRNIVINHACCTLVIKQKLNQYVRTNWRWQQPTAHLIEFSSTGDFVLTGGWYSIVLCVCVQRDGYVTDQSLNLNGGFFSSRSLNWETALSFHAPAAVHAFGKLQCTHTRRLEIFHWFEFYLCILFPRALALISVECGGQLKSREFNKVMWTVAGRLELEKR